MADWISFKITVPTEQTELASAALHEAGCGGVQVEDVELRDRGEDADILLRENALVTGYFEVDAANSEAVAALREQVREHLAAYGIETSIAVKTMDGTDWSTKWRENFPPLHIGPFVIIPTWEETTPGEDEIPILLDPGLAFGTGQHPTTHMCLELLGERAPLLSAKTMLDAGCGSGVLSIAAAKLGATVTASDLDPHCTAATRENIVLNEVAQNVEVVQAAGLDWCEKTFDVTIANLMSDLLISLTGELRRVTKPGGTLIVSGISSPRADDVEAAITSAGFTRLEKRERDGEVRGEVLERWAAFVFSG